MDSSQTEKGPTDNYEILENNRLFSEYCRFVRERSSHRFIRLKRHRRGDGLVKECVLLRHVACPPYQVAVGKGGTAHWDIWMMYEHWNSCFPLVVPGTSTAARNIAVGVIHDGRSTESELSAMKYRMADLAHLGHVERGDWSFHQPPKCRLNAAVNTVTARKLKLKGRMEFDPFQRWIALPQVARVYAYWNQYVFYARDSPTLFYAELNYVLHTARTYNTRGSRCPPDGTVCLSSLIPSFFLNEHIAAKWLCCSGSRLDAAVIDKRAVRRAMTRGFHNVIVMQRMAQNDSGSLERGRIIEDREVILGLRITSPLQNQLWR
ncbi:hypothetical protein DFH09DRAFT_1085823 [Mycena vulgaris]|nr:hypothetical protein DFH09DRAFT_1085823 [Mycena vulgaris]